MIEGIRWVEIDDDEIDTRPSALTYYYGITTHYKLQICVDNKWVDVGGDIKKYREAALTAKEGE